MNYHWLEHTHAYIVTEGAWWTRHSHPKMGTQGYFCLLWSEIETYKLTGCVNGGGGAGMYTSLFTSNRTSIPGYCNLEMIAKFILKAFWFEFLENLCIYSQCLYHFGFKVNSEKNLLFLQKRNVTKAAVSSDIFLHIHILTCLAIHLEFPGLFIICVILYWSCYLQVLNLLS